MSSRFVAANSIVRYSPICDTDAGRYDAYLATLSRVASVIGRCSCVGHCLRSCSIASFSGLGVNDGSGDLPSGGFGRVWEGLLSESVGSGKTGEVQDYEKPIGSSVCVESCSHCRSVSVDAVDDHRTSVGDVCGVDKVDGKGCLPGESTVQRNQRWKNVKRSKKQRKREKMDDGVTCVSGDSVSVAKRTLEEKWVVQNELEKKRLQRQIDLLDASSLEDDIRRQTTMVKKQTEANMVAIEKTHRYLSATGNVAGEPAGGHGFAKTIISGSDTISPDSSASMKEFRDMQKKLLDVEKEKSEVEAENARLKSGIRDVGMDPDLIDVYRKSDWTVDEHGNFPADSLKKLDEMYPDGFMTDCMTEARRINGKITLGITPATGEPVYGGRLKESEPLFDRVSVEQIIAGVDSNGYPIDSNGIRYTKETAEKWIKTWGHLRQYVSLFKDEEQMAFDAKTSVAVIRKYIRLKEKFNL